MRQGCESAARRIEPLREAVDLTLHPCQTLIDSRRHCVSCRWDWVLFYRLRRLLRWAVSQGQQQLQHQPQEQTQLSAEQNRQSQVAKVVAMDIPSPTGQGAAAS